MRDVKYYKYPAESLIQIFIAIDGIKGEHFV